MVKLWDDAPFQDAFSSFQDAACRLSSKSCKPYFPSLDMLSSKFKSCFPFIYCITIQTIQNYSICPNLSDSQATILSHKLHPTLWATERDSPGSAQAIARALRARKHLQGSWLITQNRKRKIRKNNNYWLWKNICLISLICRSSVAKCCFKWTPNDVCTTFRLSSSFQHPEEVAT